MSKLSSKELDLYSNKMLEDYDAKNPSQLFKDKDKKIRKLQAEAATKSRKEAFLLNSPESDQNYFMVPKVVE